MIFSPGLTKHMGLRRNMRSGAKKKISHNEAAKSVVAAGCQALERMH